ncbi:DUF1302 family protein [Rhodoferax sp. GW822-FHT02A01]|uniref:DUF1302 domain-containing protein n=1 Tax=Rhodoferax sp. GW822-FHT02A01 TaxID=3141537 RepID=UPI00315C6F39
MKYKYRKGRVGLSVITTAVVTVLAGASASAMEFDTGNPDITARWDNTFKYSTMYRLNNPDAAQVATYAAAGGAADDGENSFRQGIASSRMDWLTELDLGFGADAGLRVSAAAWYDPVYQRGNANTSAATSNNPLGTPANQFAPGTVDALGQGSRLMDAFVYKKGLLGDMPASVRFGNHTVIYGETLMSGSNGIAAAQGPVDIVKAATVPGAQVKEFLLPTPQVSGSLQVNDKLTLGAYYQLGWQKSPFFAPGSFLSPNDFLGPSHSFLPGITTRTPDQTASDSGQWGAQARIKGGDVEYGVYAANYHDKTPSAVYLNVGVNPVLTGLGLTPPASIAPTTFTQVYGQNIGVVGASASTVWGSDNVSMEVSQRSNMPLTGGSGYVVATTTLLGGPAYDNNNNPGYAVGTTQHMTLVDIHVIQPNFLMRDGGSIATQIDYHRVASVEKNQGVLNASIAQDHSTEDAATITSAFSADWFQAADGLDLSIPLVVSYSVGRSRVFAAWVDHGGTVSTGVNFTYNNVWKGGLLFNHYYGPHGVGLFDQTLWDRDYLSFNISRSF